MFKVRVFLCNDLHRSNGAHKTVSLSDRCVHHRELIAPLLHEGLFLSSDLLPLALGLGLLSRLRLELFLCKDLLPLFVGDANYAVTSQFPIEFGVTFRG